MLSETRQSNGKNSEQGEDPSRLQTRYRLINAAAQMISTHGYEGMSLRKVAEAVGITGAAVYRHFPGGKIALYEATLGMVADHMGEAMATDAAAVGANERPPIDGFIGECEKLWDFFADHPAIASMVVRENINGGHDGEAPSPYLEHHQQYVEAARLALDSAIADGHIQPINVSALLFWITSYVTNFHGSHELRRVVWRESDLPAAREDFLQQIRTHLCATPRGEA